MGTTVVMDPFASWAARKQEAALLARQAPIQAAADVAELLCVEFPQVTLIEYDKAIDVGVLRLEPTRLVFAGRSQTRVVPFGTIVLLGVQPLLGGGTECCINCCEYQATLTLRGGQPLEYHIGAWYHRWLEDSPTEVDTSDTLALPPPTR